MENKNLKQENIKSLFSINAITIASFVGGWVAGLMMMSYNLRQFGRQVEARKLDMANIVFTILFFVGIFIIPEEVMEMIPRIVFTIAYVVSIQMYAKKTQEVEIKKYFDNGGKRCSIFKIFLYVLFSILVTLLPLIIFIVGQIFGTSAFDCSNHKLKESNRNKKIFIHEEAVCFIYDNLDSESITLDEVYEVVALEGEALHDAGILGDYDNEGMSEVSQTQEFDPLSYITKNNKSGLSEQEIIHILKVEEEYLKFIGAME